MHIFLFARDGVGVHICDSVMRTASVTKYFDNIEDLVCDLWQSTRESVLAVLIIGSQNELVVLQQMKMLLNDIRIVLILPDRSSETIALGYELHPLFMGCLEDDGEAIAAIVGKILAQQRIRPTEFRSGRELHFRD